MQASSAPPIDSTARRRRAWRQMRRPVPAIALAAPTALLAFVLYVFELAPTVYWSDTAELQRAAATLDLPHPTGYPLYLILGRVWIALVPWRDTAWRMNLLSAVLAAVAVGLATVLVLRLTRQPVAAVGAGLALAFAPSFWSQAIVAEVYALHAVLALALLSAVLAPRPRPWLVALLVGLGLAHHRMTVLLLPGVAWAVVARRRSFGASKRDMAIAGACFALGLTPYTLTLSRIGWSDPQAFVAYVLHTGAAWWSGAGLMAYVADVLWPIGRQQLGPLGMVLAVGGLAWCLLRCRGDRRAAGGAVAISWVSAAAFFALYRVPDAFALATHFLVLHAVAIGLGLAAVFAAVRRAPDRMRPGATAAIAASLAVGLLWQANGARAAVRQDKDDWLYPRDRSLGILRDTGGGAVLAADYLLGQTILYLQDVEGLRPDMRTLVHDRDAGWAESLLGGNRPVYLWGTAWREALAGDPDVELVAAENTPYEQGLFRLVNVDSWAAVPVRHTPVDPTSAAVGPLEGPRLTEVTYRPWPLRADEPMEIGLCWEGDLGHLEGATVFWDVGFPRPWFRHEFGSVGERGAPGCTRLTLVLPPAPFGTAATGSLSLAMPDGGGERLLVDAAALEVRPSSGAIGHGRTNDTLPAVGAFSAPGIELDGLAHPASTRPGVAVPVDSAWWWAGGALDAPVRLELADAHGKVVSSAEVVLPAVPEPTGTSTSAGARTSTSTSGRGAVLVGAEPLLLAVPRRAPAGDYSIRARIGQDGRPVPVSGVRVEDWDHVWRIPKAQLEIDSELADGAIRLRGADVARDGHAVRLTLYWEAAHETDDDWTVFVHAVDLGDAIVAQDDAPPGEGPRWTDGWRRGEVVVDEHTLELPANAVAEPLRLFVGLYDASTGGRAPAYDRRGVRFPDDAVPLAAIGTGTPVLESPP